MNGKVNKLIASFFAPLTGGRKKIYGAMVLLLAACASLHAGDEVFRSRLSASRVVPGQKLDVKDHRYQTMRSDEYWRSKFDHHNVVNQVILAIDHDAMGAIDAPFTVTVTADVSTMYHNTGKLFTKLFHGDQQFQIEYSPDGSYKAKDVLTLENAGHFVEVTIKDVQVEGIAELPPVKMEAVIRMDRYYRMESAQDIQVVQEDRKASSGELYLQWDYIHGAEEYELEWTFFDNYEKKKGDDDNWTTEIPAEELRFDQQVFKRNSTRIITQDNFYRIPLIYERGYLIYQVRAVGRIISDGTKKKYTNWSAEDLLKGGCRNVSCFTDKFKIEMGHQSNMPWLANTVFAEDGKSKLAISYHDGALRSRQISSKMQENDETVVSDMLYDYQGQNVGAVMPAPTGKTKVQYENKFNKRAGQDRAFGPEDFDVLQETDDCKTTELAGLDKSSGAANYYSEMNPKANDDPFNKENYLPNSSTGVGEDLPAYPLSRTEYSRDNRQRVTLKGGVGKEFQIGGGHDVKYMYDIPRQAELDRLFGTDVGYADHYTKEIMVDANGQVVVTYKDLADRVVATGYSGVHPLNLDPIYQKDGEGAFSLKEFNVNLMDEKSDGTQANNKVQINKGRVLYNAPLVMENETDISLNYNVIGSKYEYDCYTPEGEDLDYCSDCVFDLKVKLYDECGSDVLGGVLDTVVGVLDTTGGKAPISCENTVPDITRTAENVRLKQGEYTLVKELELNEDVLDYYANEFIKNQENCLKTLEDFEAEEDEFFDYDECEFSCSQCDDPDLTDPELIALCEALCEIEMSDLSAETKLAFLKADMNPGGQYARHTYEMFTSPDVRPAIEYGEEGEETETDDSETENEVASAKTKVFAPARYALSVLNVSNRLPVKMKHPARDYYTEGYRPNWRYPYCPECVTAVGKGHYYDDEGNLSTVLVKYKGDKTGREFDIADGKDFEPQVRIPRDGTKLSRGGGDNFFKVYPEDLESVKDFVAAWQPSWANSLVTYHPEYNHYVFYKEVLYNADNADNLSSSRFDDILFQSQTPDLLVKNLAEYAPDLTFDFDDFTDHPMEYDPYFKFATGDRTAIKERMQQNITAFARGKSLKTFAYLLRNCPAYDPEGAPCIEDCTIGDTDGDGISDEKITVDEFENFKAMYLTLKKDMIDIEELNYSMEFLNSCYNGCFDDENFTMMKDGFMFTPLFEGLLAEDDQYKEDFCNEYPKSLLSALGDVIAYNSQIFNWQQPCSYYTYQFYRNKKARFPTTKAAMGMIDVQYEDVCYEEVDETSIETNSWDIAETARTPVDCPDQDLQLTASVKRKRDLVYYESCDLCPAARALDVLLKGVAENDGWTASDFSLICSMTDGQQTYPFLDPDLVNLIPGEGDLRWKVDGSSAHDHLTIKLEQEMMNPGDDVTFVTFYFPADFDNSFDFADIVHACCLEVEDWGTSEVKSGGTPEAPGHNFSIMVTNEEGVSSSNQSEKLVRIYGKINTIALDDCDFGLSCRAENVTKDLFELFNGLLFRDENKGISAVMFTGENVEFEPEPISPENGLCDDIELNLKFPYYVFFDKGLEKKLKEVIPQFDKSARDWGWRAEEDFNADPNIIEGHIIEDAWDPDDINGHNSNLLRFKKEDSDYDWTDIIAFTQVKGKSPADLAWLINGTGSRYAELIALVKTNSGTIEYRKIELYSNYLILSRCVDPLMEDADEFWANKKSSN